jgi:DinB superfamily
LKVQLRNAWSYSRSVLDGIVEQEYFWEPAPLNWSVRRRETASRGWGSGEFVCEDAWPPPEPLPITTIAWRVIHLAAWTDIYRVFAFEDSRADLNDSEVPGDCFGGLAWLRRSQDQFMAAVDSLTDESMFEMRPAHWGEAIPAARLVTSMLTEHVHHIAEIGVLRDLHRGCALGQPPPPTPPGPPWWSAANRPPP